jgi:hybrid cluster-associated redox disulfide protein
LILPYSRLSYNFFKSKLSPTLKTPVSESDIISEIIRLHPGVDRLLSDYGLVCVSCPLSHCETLGDGARLHGLTDQEIKKMLKDINSRLT